jgi:hypothetical protein
MSVQRLTSSRSRGLFASPLQSVVEDRGWCAVVVPAGPRERSFQSARDWLNSGRHSCVSSESFSCWDEGGRDSGWVV